MNFQDTISKIREFSDQNPFACPSVLNSVIYYLELGRVEDARWKIQNDSDKFTSSEFDPVFRLFDSVGLISPEYRLVLEKQGWESTALLEMKKDRDYWKSVALYLAECHAATAGYDASLKSVSKSRKQRLAGICRKAMNMIQGKEMPPPRRRSPQEEIPFVLEGLRDAIHEADPTEES